MPVRSTSPNSCSTGPALWEFFRKSAALQGKSPWRTGEKMTKNRYCYCFSCMKVRGGSLPSLHEWVLRNNREQTVTARSDRCTQIYRVLSDSKYVYSQDMYRSGHYLKLIRSGHFSENSRRLWRSRREIQERFRRRGRFSGYSTTLWHLPVVPEPLQK